MNLLWMLSKKLIDNQYLCTIIIIVIGGGFGWMSGAINSVLDWRWTFRLLGIAGLCVLPMAAMALYEPKSIKQRRLKRMKGKKVYSIWVRETVC